MSINPYSKERLFSSHNIHRLVFPFESLSLLKGVHSEYLHT